MSTREILREGQWTNDGRMLPVGSVTWSEDPLPMLDDGMLAGTLTNVRREGNRILVETTPDLGDDMIVTADCDYPDGTDTVVEVAPGHIEMRSVRLRAGHVNERSFYPWSDEQEGGDANAR